MKSFDEIKKNVRLSRLDWGIDGFAGEISMPMWRGSVICSHGGGWNHVSICPYKKSVMPTYYDLCLIKEMFWDEEEAVIHVFPPKSQHVNIMTNCLHLWECYYKEMVLPPSCFVGIREGQTKEELEREIEAAYKLAGEPYYD